MPPVLVADDDASVRLLMRRILESEGHIVLEAEDGRDALDVINSRRPDISLVDVRMPKLDGFGVLRELANRGEHRVLLVTGAVDEEAPLAPRSPYAASKAAGDLLVHAFRQTHGLPAMVVRPTNIFGPAQLPEKFIPLCITNSLDGLPVPIYGDGQQRRAWLFVEDLWAALQVIVERGEVGETYNVAGGTEQANLGTAKSILSSLGLPGRLLQFVADRPGHDRRYAMTDGKLRALGWRPKTSFEQGLSATVAWYRDHVEWWRPLAQKLREDPYHWLDRPAGTRPQQEARAIR